MSHGPLFQLATDTKLMVADALRSSPPAVSFMRNLTPGEGLCWADLVDRIGGRTVNIGEDAVSWSLTASGKFSVKSLYGKLTEGSALDIARGLWKAGIPLKTKIFLWQMFCNRLPTSDNVAKRNGPSNGTCDVCGQGEDANHVFFRCHLARFAWSAVREAFGQNWNPASGAGLLALLRT